MKTTFKFSIYTFPRFQDTLEEINKKLNKKGLSPFSISSKKEILVDEVPFLEIELSSNFDESQLIEKGYKYLGFIRLDKGETFSRVSLENHDLSSFKSFENISCSHCGTKLKVFSQVLEKNGKFETWGKTCFSDIFGTNLEYIQGKFESLEHDFPKVEKFEPSDLWGKDEIRYSFDFDRLFHFALIAFSFDSVYRKDRQTLGLFSEIRSLVNNSQEKKNLEKLQVYTKNLKNFDEKTLNNEFKTFWNKEKIDSLGSNFGANIEDLLFKNGTFRSEISSEKLGLFVWSVYHFLNTKNLSTKEEKENLPSASFLKNDTFQGIFYISKMVEEENQWGYSTKITARNQENQWISFYSTASFISCLEVGKFYPLKGKVKSRLEVGKDNFPLNIVSHVKPNIEETKEYKKEKKAFNKALKDVNILPYNWNFNPFVSIQENKEIYLEKMTLDFGEETLKEAKKAMEKI